MNLTFASVVNTTYNAYVFRVDTDSAPEREYDVLTAAGRNGAYLKDKKRFPNVPMSYYFFFVPGQNTTAEENYNSWRQAYMSKIGYHRLSDTEHPNEYYKAYLVRITPTVSRERSLIKALVEFSRLPMRYLTAGELVTTLTADGTVSNPTQFPSMPSLRVYGNGVLTINSDTITISGASSYTDIDFETGECIGGTITLSTPDFVPLISGNNTFDLGDGITKVEITPRWWQV